MVRPVIGICTPLERARWGAWDVEALVLPTSFVDPVRRAGAMALLLAPDAAVADAPDELLDRIDGLMLAGGADLDPASYGAAPHPLTLDPDTPLQDARRRIEDLSLDAAELEVTARTT